MGLRQVPGESYLACPTCGTRYDGWVEEGDGMFVDYDEYCVRRWTEEATRAADLLDEATPDREEVWRLLTEGKLDLRRGWAHASEEVRREVLRPLIARALAQGVEIDWDIVRAATTDVAERARRAAERLAQLPRPGNMWDQQQAYAIVSSLKDALDAGEDISEAIAEVEAWSEHGVGAHLLFCYRLGRGELDRCVALFERHPWSLHQTLTESGAPLAPFVPKLVEQAIEADHYLGESEQTRAARERAATRTLLACAAEPRGAAVVLAELESWGATELAELAELVARCRSALRGA